MTQHPSGDLLAEIPLLDWTGPAFLQFFLPALAAAALWSLARSRRCLEKFDATSPAPPLTDPYEIAFLTAGAQRATQLAIVQLIQRGLAAWKSTTSGAALISTPEEALPDLPPVERMLHSALKKASDGQISGHLIAANIAASLRGIEVRLATLGLRPTTSERARAAIKSTHPLLVIIALGVIKLVIGLFRDKPVGILVISLILAVVALGFILNAAPCLPPSGSAMLARLLGEKMPVRRPTGEEDAAPHDRLAWSFALAGPPALAGIAAFASVQGDLERQMKQAAARVAAVGAPPVAAVEEGVAAEAEAVAAAAAEVKPAEAPFSSFPRLSSAPPWAELSPRHARSLLLLFHAGRPSRHPSQPRRRL